MATDYRMRQLGKSRSLDLLAFGMFPLIVWKYPHCRVLANLLSLFRYLCRAVTLSAFTLLSTCGPHVLRGCAFTSLSLLLERAPSVLSIT